MISNYILPHIPHVLTLPPIHQPGLSPGDSHCCLPGLPCPRGCVCYVIYTVKALNVSDPNTQPEHTLEGTMEIEMGLKDCLQASDGQPLFVPPGRSGSTFSTCSSRSWELRGGLPRCSTHLPTPKGGLKENLHYRVSHWPLQNYHSLMLDTAIALLCMAPPLPPHSSFPWWVKITSAPTW